MSSPDRSLARPPLARSLEGRRVVVTRARHQVDAFAAALEERGAQVLFLPTIVIRPAVSSVEIDDAVRTISRFTWIVLTSANAVAEFWKRLREAGVDALPAGLRVAAVGPATSAALSDHGVSVNAEPLFHAGGAVAGAMGDLRGARVLFPRGDRARQETAAALRHAGAYVTEVVVYRTEMETPNANVLRELRHGVDALTFTSPSTVAGFSAVCGSEAVRFAKSSVVATIGPTTSAAVRDEGWGEPLESAVATSNGIVRALEGHFAGQPAPVDARK